MLKSTAIDNRVSACFVENRTLLKIRYLTQILAFSLGKAFLLKYSKMKNSCYSSLII